MAISIQTLPNGTLLLVHTENGKVKKSVPMTQKEAHEYQAKYVATEGFTKPLAGNELKTVLEDNDIMATKLQNKVHLRDATALSEPVFGTSSGSTYLVCFMTDRFNVAVRNKAGNISIRVEPRVTEGLALPVVALLKQIGFAIGDADGTYMSQHFAASGGPYAACGAYGAVMEQLSYLFYEEIIAKLDWYEAAKTGG